MSMQVPDWMIALHKLVSGTKRMARRACLFLRGMKECKRCNGGGIYWDYDYKDYVCYRCNGSGAIPRSYD